MAAEAVKGATTGAAAGMALGPWGAAVGGAVGLIGGIFGANKAAKQRRKIERYWDGQAGENEAWYQANANADYTQRADAQNLIRQMRENLGRQTQRTENMSVITGSTPEQEALQKENSTRAIADLYANIGVQGQQFKDRVTDRYLARKQDIGNQKMGIANAKANSYENVMTGGFGMLTNAIPSIVDGFMKK